MRLLIDLPARRALSLTGGSCRSPCFIGVIASEIHPVGSGWAYAIGLRLTIIFRTARCDGS